MALYYTKGRNPKTVGEEFTGKKIAADPAKITEFYTRAVHDKLASSKEKSPNAVELQDTLHSQLKTLDKLASSKEKRGDIGGTESLDEPEPNAAAYDLLAEHGVRQIVRDEAQRKSYRKDLIAIFSRPFRRKRQADAHPAGNDTAAVEDPIDVRIVRDSFDNLEHMCLSFTKMGPATARIELQPIEAGYLQRQNSREKIPVYRVTFSCEFCGTREWIIDDARIRTSFAPRNEQPSPSDTAITGNPGSPRSPGASTSPLDQKSRPFRSSSTTSHASSSKPGTPTSLHAKTIPIPTIEAIAPTEHFGQPLSTPPRTVNKVFSPEVGIAGATAKVGQISVQETTTSTSRMSISGKLVDTSSMDNSAEWRIKANSHAENGIPRKLSFVTWVSHTGSDHRPLDMTFDVKWGLRSALPRFMRPIFGWQMTTAAKPYLVQCDGNMSGLMPIDSAILDKHIADWWEARKPQGK